MDKIEVTIQFTADDLQQAYSLHFRKNYPFRSRLVLVLGAILVILGFFLALLQSMAGMITWISWFFVVYGLLVIAYYFWRVRRMGKSAYKKLIDFHYPFTFSITEEGINTVGKTVSSQNSWEHYQTAMITQDMVILYPNKLRFVLLPRKYFHENDYAQLTKLVREKVKCK